MSIFTNIRAKRPAKSKFDLSHHKVMSLKMGDLIPVLCQEILPGDNFKVNSEIMMRLAPMIAPVMHRINVYTHFFFIPNRILWDEWEDFITGGPDGTLAPIPPYYGSNQVLAELGNKTLSDYLGLPNITAGTTDKLISALPFRAYSACYNEYYRDQTLTPELAFSKTGGGQTLADFQITGKIRKRSWEKDYFTSSLPFSQRGPESTIPINGVVDPGTFKTGNIRKTADDTLASSGPLQSVLGVENINAGPETVYHEITGQGSLASGSTTINDLRKSVRLQEWLEKNARGGARYVEQLLSHFGIAPNDARLQRPEYLGGGKQPVVISEVLNTAGSTTLDLQPVGEMAGHGISVGNQNKFQKTFQEHGFVLGIMSVLPETMYFQGLPRMFGNRFSKLAYAWPEFAQLGEQEIFNSEIYFTGAESAAQLDATFGYTPRFSEYKYGCSTVHGEFRDSLDYWHMARKFATPPALNDAFVSSDPDKRIFAVTDPDTDDLYCQIYHNISAIRPLPYYGTPTL